jgi:hypothetical protein
MSRFRPSRPKAKALRADGKDATVTGIVRGLTQGVDKNLADQARKAAAMTEGKFEGEGISQAAKGEGNAA